MTVTRPAAPPDLGWIAPAAIASGAVGSREELEAVLAAEPWRVRVTDDGDAALLERWRPELADLAIAGLWCPPRRIPSLIADLAEVAAAHGFERLLAPIVHQDAARPYLAAGMSVLESVEVMRLERRALARAGAATLALPASTVLRDAADGELDAVSALDAACFPPFWHYGPEMHRRLSAGGRLGVAERDGELVGYTLCTLHGSQGSLGRIAVAPHLQRQGIGRALIADAVSWSDRHGARTVVLSTQVGNEAARALYRSAGFVDVSGRLVVLATGRLRGSEERG